MYILENDKVKFLLTKEKQTKKQQQQQTFKI